MKQYWLVAALSVACLPVSAQGYPQGSQVISYFPHLAVGGPSGARWTTNLTFVNPHQSAGANTVAYFYDDNGAPLALDFGSGPTPTLNFSVPAQGSLNADNRFVLVSDYYRLGRCAFRAAAPRHTPI